MKTIFMTFTLLFTLPAFAMDKQRATHVTKLKELTEKLQTASNNLDTEKRVKTKLDDAYTTYQSLSADEQNAYMKQKLDQITNNLKESKEMLDEDRQNARFLFFPGNEDDESQIDEDTLLKEINDDTAELAQNLSSNQGAVNVNYGGSIEPWTGRPHHHFDDWHIEYDFK
jgi:hypothetical protein